MLEHGVDGVGLGFGQKTDPAQVDAQHRNVGIACEFRGAQKSAVAAECQHQLASVGGVRVGVDDLDPDAHRAHVVRAQVQRSPVDRLGRQHPKANIVVVQHFLDPTRGLGGFLASGVNHQQDGALTRHCGPDFNSREDRAFQLISGQAPIRLGAQPQEVFDVARRTR